MFTSFVNDGKVLFFKDKSLRLQVQGSPLFPSHAHPVHSIQYTLYIQGWVGERELLRLVDRRKVVFGRRRPTHKLNTTVVCYRLSFSRELSALVPGIFSGACCHIAGHNFVALVSWQPRLAVQKYMRKCRRQAGERAYKFWSCVGCWGCHIDYIRGCARTRSQKKKSLRSACMFLTFFWNFSSGANHLSHYPKTRPS